MITYDDKLLATELIGQNGISNTDRQTAFPKLDSLITQINAGKIPENFDFLSSPTDVTTLNQIQTAATTYKTNFDTILVLGIGGSDLGTRAITQAILHPFHNNLAATNRPGMRIFFAGANTDPRELSTVLAQIDWQKTIINVISKSGETLETMSAFLICLEALTKVVGQDKAKTQVIATTGQNGTLKQIATEQGFYTLQVPNNIGGRYSVLTTVGLFPLACAGINITNLLSGAASLTNRLKEGPDQHPSVKYALNQYLGYTQKNQTMSVLMPYAKCMSDFTLWYRQLWSESLGKAQSLTNQTINIGPTPIDAIGATDQHSQIQLYIEGPFNKQVTFIVTDHCRADITIPNIFPQYPDLAILSTKKMSELLAIEHKATAAALAQNGRPNGTIRLSTIDETNLGELIMMFQLATAFSGTLYNVNAFDQPGVEYGKKNIKAILNPTANPDIIATLSKYL